MRKTRIRKTAMFLLTFVIVCCILPIPTYAAFDKTADDAVAWVLGHTEGVGYEYDGATDRWINGEYWIMSCQCVDLIRGYMDYISGTHTSGNGGKYTSNWLPDGYTRIKKYNGFVPEKGDILIWPGEIGHVAIVTAVNSATEIVYSDQNGASVNGVSYAKKVKHGRKMNPANNDYWGVIRPDFSKGPYTLDVNGWLDGKDVTNVYGYGTFDMYLGGTRVRQSEGDYWNQEVKTGTSYTIKNVKAADGKVFAGFKSGTYTGTVSKDTTIVMEFRTFNAKDWVSKHKPTKEKTYDGHTYKYFSDKVTWHEAHFICMQLGGHLVGIGDKNENSFVNELTGHTTAWTGATRSDQNLFFWEDYSVMKYQNWAPGEPNNATTNAAGAENYVTIYGIENGSSAGKQNDGKWNDIHGYAQYGFVCEIDKDDNCYTLDVNGWLDGEELDNIQGIGTFDSYIDGKKTENDIHDYYNTILPSGTKYEFKDIKAADGYEYVGVKSGSLSGTMNGNVKIVLEFRKKVEPSFTFNVDKTKFEVGETYAQIGYFKVYSNIDLNLVKRVGCKLYSSDGKVLSGDEEDANIVGDHLTHYFHISGDAGEQDIRYALFPNTQYYVRMYVIYKGKEYYSDKQVFTTKPSSVTPSPNVSVNFTPWESQTGLTYIGETDASIGMVIDVTGGTCTETGMHLFNSKGNKLASAKNNGYTNHYIYFRINEEANYSLTPDTIYMYKFYAIVNGNTYWSQEDSFKTKPTVTPEPTVILTITPTPTVKPTEPTPIDSTVTPTPTATVKPASPTPTVKPITPTPTATSSESGATDTTPTPTATVKPASPTPTVKPITPTPRPVTPQPNTPEDAYVTINGLKNKLSVWKEANSKTGRLGYAYNGDVFELLAIEGDWYKIRYNGKVGYVTGEHVFVTDVNAAQNGAYVTIINVKNKLSVRKDASAETKRLGYAYNDETYPLIAVKGKWYKIQYQPNVVGYVHEDYVRATNEYLVPHMKNEWESYTPKPTKVPTPKPTPTQEVYVTEPPAYVTEPPAEDPVTEQPVETYPLEPSTANDILEPPEDAADVTEPSAESQLFEPETNALDEPTVMSEEASSTDMSEDDPEATVSDPVPMKDADATKATKRPSAGRRIIEEDEEDEKQDSRLGIALIGIGCMLIASLGGVAAILIHRRRINSKKHRGW